MKKTNFFLSLGKKGMGVKFMVGGAIALLIFSMSIYILYGTFNSTTDAFAPCPGTCKERCTFPETAYFSGSQECRAQEGTGDVCCVTAQDLMDDQDDQTNSNDGERPPQSDTLAIQIRSQGNNVGEGSTQSFNVGESANLRIWGTGENANDCSIQIRKDGQRESIGSFSDRTRTECVDRFVDYEFTPSNEDVGEYEITILLFNSMGTRLQSTSFNIKVE